MAGGSAEMDSRLAVGMVHFFLSNPNPANIYMFKVNNRDTRKSYENFCSKLTIKTPK